MIPKTIHYIWLGDDKKPLLIRKCIKSWNRELLANGWQIKCWNMENIPHNAWVDEAISRKKWAFASDYTRLYALYTEGGVYLDTDVFIRKDLSEFTDNDFFIPIEYNPEKFQNSDFASIIDEKGCRLPGADGFVAGLTAQSAIVGAKKENQIIKDMMDFYERSHFIKPDGSNNYDCLAPDIMAFTLEKYGFRYADESYELHSENCIGGGIVGRVYDTSFFASGIKSASKECRAVHMYTSTWQDASFAGKMIRDAKTFVKWLMV